MGKPTEADFPAELRNPPSSFTVQLESIGAQAIRWRGTVVVTDAAGHSAAVECEVGYSMREDSEDRQTQLRKEVWLLFKAGEAGRVDLLSYARIDRHKGPNRVVSAPGITITKSDS